MFDTFEEALIHAPRQHPAGETAFKIVRYSNLTATSVFVPVAGKTAGTYNNLAVELNKETVTKASQNKLHLPAYVRG